MSSTTKARNFVVRLVHPPGEVGVGPFVVQARTVRGAFRVVRFNYAHMITDHMSRERKPLECEGVTSSRIGYMLVGK